MSTSQGTDFAALIEPVARQVLGEPNHKLSNGKQLRFGSHGSVSVEIGGDKKGTWFDHECNHGGGTLDLLRLKKGLVVPDSMSWLEENGFIPGREKEQPKPKSKFVEAYDYKKASGELAYQVVRKDDPKTFPQRRPDGKGGWIWGLDGVERVLYRLPELISTPLTTIIYIPEGEKDVDALRKHMLVATCNPGGAGKWRKEYNEYFRGRHVVVLPDNDPQAVDNDGNLRFHPDGSPVLPGQDHAADVAKNLRGTAASVRVLMLPNLPPKGDVSDWLKAGGTADALEALVKDTKESAQPEPELLWRAPTVKETDIPRRIYIVPGYIQRGVVTEIVGPGGHGKSLLFLIWAVALALGIAFGGFRPTRPMRVATLDAEDDLDEQDRRVAAILRMFDKHHCDLDDRLRIMNPMRTGMVLDFDPKTRRLSHTGLMGELQDVIHQFKPDLLMLNPLGELHNAEENDNGTLRHIVGEFRVMAKQEDIGLLLGHHTRKGVPEHGNADAGRGASSIGGVVRKTYTLYEMTAAEGTGWKIPDPQMYFRLDGAKANYDAKNATEWFQRSVVTLDNQDSVVSAVPWFPPSEAITEETVTILMGIVAEGSGGQPWTMRLGKYERSISHAMAAQGIQTRAGQDRMLAILIAKGCQECGYTKPNRTLGMGLRHPNGGPQVTWKE